jgi:3-oxoacyl-[acyl-carrier-protein] synthase II
MMNCNPRRYLRPAADRIGVTGVGFVTPIGVGTVQFWENLVAGKSGIGPVRSFSTDAFKVHNGGEVRDFDPAPYFQTLDARRVGRCSQLAIAASRMALDDAGLSRDALSWQRVGVVMGTTMGEPRVLETLDEQWVSLGVTNVDADLVPRYPCHVIPSNVALEFGFNGPNIMIPTACSAGNYAIAYACELLKQKRAEVMVTGGADCFSRIAFTGFARLSAIAPELCQPFSRDRKGMMVAEGAAMLILESLEHARARNAPVYAEVLGYGHACDAFHMTGSHPEGRGTISAMRRALQQSGIEPRNVNYISAHGTGTPTNDRVETIAIREVFGEDAYRIPVSSIKSMMGHTMGAASAIEAGVCVLAIRHEVIPPTINYSDSDPECDLDYVPNRAREHNVKIALNNSAAFGGNNAVTIFGEVE